jgi:phage anti-repressor protein
MTATLAKDKRQRINVNRGSLDKVLNISTRWQGWTNMLLKETFISELLYYFDIHVYIINYKNINRQTCNIKTDWF